MKSARLKGQLKVWKDDKGFGFIKSSNSGQDVFLHITALKNVGRRPQAGDVICYQLTVDQNGRPRACNAFIEQEPSQTVQNASSVSSTVTAKQPGKSTTDSLFFPLEVLFLSLLPGLGSIHLALTAFNLIPLILYPLMSLLTFVLYAEDKSRAKQRLWRISEKTLHLCELMGGWLGAFIAQKKLHHKNSKTSYQAMFWTIVMLHIGFWFDWLFLGGTLMNLLVQGIAEK